MAKTAIKSPKAKNVSFFRKSVQTIRENPKLTFYVFSAYIAMFLLFYIINTLMNWIFPDNSSFASQFSNNTLLWFVVILIILLYFAVLLLIYSFFSIIILGNVKSMTSDHEFDFSSFKKMFGINCLLFIVSTIFFMIFTLLLSFSIDKSVWVGVSIGVIAGVIAVLMYALWSFAHNAYILGHEWGPILKKSLQSTLTRHYVGVLLFDVGFVALYLVLYFAFGYVFQNAITANYELFSLGASAVTFLLLCVLFTFNTIYFFMISEHVIGEK